MQDLSHHTVLGAGEHMRRAHLQFLKPPQVKLLDIFDPGAVTDTLRTELSVPARFHESSSAALAERAGAVWIGSPDKFHMSQLEAALNAGKHVFVEKPLATRVDELATLRRLLSEAEAKNLIVLSCHPRRFDPPFIWIKDRLPDLTQHFGAPLSVSFDFTYHAPVADWKHSRSLLLDHANHEIDLVNFLFGESSVSATRHHDSATHYHLTGKRGDGLVISLSGTRLLEGKIYDELLRVRFERAEVSFHATRGECQIYDHEGRISRIEAAPPTNYAARNQSVTENFIEAIAGVTAPYLTSAEILFNTEFSVHLAEEGRYSCSNS